MLNVLDTVIPEQPRSLGGHVNSNMLFNKEIFVFDFKLHKSLLIFACSATDLAHKSLLIFACSATDLATRRLQVSDWLIGNGNHCCISGPPQWRHNERDGVSNHRRPSCLLNRESRRRSKKTPKPRVIDLCEGNPPVTGGFPSERANDAESRRVWMKLRFYSHISYIGLTIS